MAFESVIAKLQQDQQTLQDELTQLDQSEAYGQMFIDQAQARRTEVLALLDQLQPAINLLEGAFD